MQTRWLSRHLARFLGIARKIPYRTLCETKSHFDSPLSSRHEKFIRSQLRSLLNFVAVHLTQVRPDATSLHDLWGRSATECPFKKVVGGAGVVGIRSRFPWDYIRRAIPWSHRGLDVWRPAHHEDTQYLRGLHRPVQGQDRARPHDAEHRQDRAGRRLPRRRAMRRFRR
jgi:hypothetical protein